jgi:WD repeat-containing protein 48
VKCLATPGPFGGFVASGGLDRKIYLWDLNGSGQQLSINVGEEENTAKGSVYALAVTSTLLASGGPESIVRVWDPRSGKRITKLVGHTDNIRDILISQDGDTVMTASSDQTVKVWSMSAGRCMYTLTMHNDSVWSLYSDHPRLSIFYSSDRSGLVAKTDTRGCAEIDEGLSVAVCQEHEGVSKVVHAGDYFWTATASSSINRWKDVDTDAEVQMPESYSFHRVSIATTTRSKIPSPPSSLTPVTTRDENPNKIPFRSVLRMSNAAPLIVYRNRDIDTSTVTSARKASEAALEAESALVVPFRNGPDHTIEGQHGLIKHVTLNDRRRVLTVDTAGEVTMWDLLRCTPIQSFGKRHLDDVLSEVNTTETVAHWCSVDTRTGSLTCVLEENNCFDAEMYADEVKIEEKIDFREDQRINLGKWILRYLFSNLIDEEIRRDEIYRKQLVESKRQSLDRAQAPSSIQIPNSNLTSWKDLPSGPTSASTLRPTNGYHMSVPPTPGLAIGLATPAAHPPSHSSSHTSTLPFTAEENHGLERTSTQNRGSSDRLSHDYFSRPPAHTGPTATPGGTANGQAVSPGGDAQTNPAPEAVQSPGPEPQEQEKSEKKLFGSKKFRMNFGMKSLKKVQTAESNVTKAVETPSEDSDSRSSKTEEKLIEDNFYGALQRIRFGYEDHLHHILHDKENKDHSPSQIKLECAITPSLPNETPVLKPPLNTTILIQEDRVDSGGVADLFEGTVSNLGTKADLIEKVAPMWLADVLLRVSFYIVFPSVASPLTNMPEPHPAERNRQGVLHPRTLARPVT